jgi:ABC-type Fe3+-siderophore transport system permease subunit
VVTVVAAVAALGTVLLGDWRPGAILGAVLTALIHWLGWCGVDDLIGRALFRRPLSLQRLVRSLGYAQTPQLLAVLAFVPIVGVWVLLGSRLLTMVAGNQAIGHAFDTRLPQALALRMVSFAIAFATAAAVRAMFGDISFVSAILQP